MSIAGPLEFIQSFNNAKIIDASDHSLKEGKLHSRWKIFTVIRNIIQLPKFLIKVENKLFHGSL